MEDTGLNEQDAAELLKKHGSVRSAVENYKK
jgi:hypothetical protein